MRTGEEDIGSNSNPKGVAADERDFNEHSDNCKPDQNEREHISKIHCASPLRCDYMPILCLDRPGGRMRTR
jgi:hypothetical protein